MPSREKRVRRRRRGSAVLPALIVIFALAAATLTVMLVNSDPFTDANRGDSYIAYPEHPNFVEQKDFTAAPLVLGASPSPEQSASPSSEPVVAVAPEETEIQEAQPLSGNRFIPEPEDGDYFLPVFDRALRTPDDEAMIAVTVDDCDVAEVMSRVIEVARSYNAKLTLFPTGEALMASGMTEGFGTCVNVYGFELENHSYAHKMEYKLSSSELAIQLWKQSVAASYVVGRDYQQHFYRPYQKESVNDQRTHFYIRKLGYEGVAGYTHSYREFNTIDALVDTLENGKIYQFDMSDDSMALFEAFVASASHKGYKLVTMNELFSLEENQIGNELTIDRQTLIEMNDYVPTYYDLKLNYRTNAVYALQARLAELGYLSGQNGEDVKADGIYGPSTSIAVSAFQAKVGIAATGNADVATQEKLFSAEAPVIFQ